MSSEIKEESLPKKGKERRKKVTITDMTKYKREFSRQYSSLGKENVTENYKLEDIKPIYCDIKNHSAKPYRTFYIFVKKLLEKDSIQINADYKDKFLGFFTQSNPTNCVK